MGTESRLFVAGKPNDHAVKRRGFGRCGERGGSGRRKPFVASKPNDHADKRRGFGTQHSPPGRNKKRIDLISLHRQRLTAPLLTAFPVTTDHLLLTTDK
jgi:hypothetical protein